jgi:trk system potassium uptake protein TrkH
LEILKQKLKLQPAQILVAGFAALTLAGALLLNLPIATVTGESMGFLDALFTATSAVCVTGLVVVDTGTFFSTFGQVVILVLVQFGGLGIMTMATLIFLLMGKKIMLRERVVMQEALNEFNLQGVVRLTKSIILTTLIIQFIGAIILATRFIPIYGVGQGIYFSVFHAVTAFCNAGFDLIGNFKSLTPFANDPVIVLTIGGLILLGGIGFSVILEVYHRRRFRVMSLHTKVVLYVTAILLVSGAIFFYIVESGNPYTIGSASLTIPGRILSALFQSIVPRTAGFNTIDQHAMTDASKFMTVIFMFIGASPGSTGGGIKTTTLGVVVLMILSVIRNKEDIELFEKRLGNGIALRALTIMLISLVLVSVITLILVMTEVQRAQAGGDLAEKFSFMNLLFEATSAFGTVGLSTGVTPYLSDTSKVALILTMFAGRVGPLTLALALAMNPNKSRANIRYPEDKLMVG